MNDKNRNNKIRIIIYLSIIVLIILSIPVIIKIGRRLAETIDNYQCKAYRNAEMNIDLSKYSNICKDDSAWYSLYSVIAHSGGGIAGKKYTNSLEAWENSYINGDRIFDADLSLTSDGYIVLRHEWSDDLGQNGLFADHLPTLNEFLSTPIYSSLTPMSLEDMICFMDSHEDIFVAVDFKDGIDLLKNMVTVFQNCNKEELIDRLIISFYEYDDYEVIQELYDFKNYAIRQYENSPHNYIELAEFCLKNDIPVCMIKYNYLKEDDVSVLLDHGITIYCAVVNEDQEYLYALENGASGIVSDEIFENEIKRGL